MLFSCLLSYSELLQKGSLSKIYRYFMLLQQSLTAISKCRYRLVQKTFNLMLDVYDCHPRSKSRDPDCCSSMVRKRSCTLLGWQDGAQKHWAPPCYEYNPVVNHEQTIFLLLVKDMAPPKVDVWHLRIWMCRLDSRVNGLEMTSHILTSSHIHTCWSSSSSLYQEHWASTDRKWWERTRGGGTHMQLLRARTLGTQSIRPMAP